MANVLDAAEMDALQQSSKEKPGASKDVQQVRLIGQDHRLRSALALLSRAQSMSTEALERAFMKLRQLPQRVEIAPIDICGPKALQKLVKDAAAVAILEAPTAGAEEAYMIFDAPLTFELTDRSFGGSGVARPDDLKAMTPLMRQNVCELASGVAHMLEECRGELWPTLRVKGPATRIDHVQQALADREAVVMRWIIAETTTLTLILPASLLSLPQRAQKGPSDEAAQKRLQEHVADVEIELRVELGRAKVSMGQLLALTAGDVLRLDRGTQEPLTVCTQELKLLECKPNAVGDHIGLVFERWSGS